MRRALVALAFLALAAGPVCADDPPALSNGAFDGWKDAVPAGWSLGDGARRGEALVPSIVEPCPGGGMRLRADEKTTRWHLVHQRVAVDPLATYRLSWEARITDAPSVWSVPSQAYVGLAGGHREPRLWIDVPSRGEFAPREVIVRGQGSESVDVRVFLPHAGSLDVRDVRLEKLEPKASLDVLVRNMDRYYAHFEGHEEAWTAAVAAAAKGTADMADEDAFVAAAKRLLAPLEDMHVWVRTKDARVLPTHVAELAPGTDFRALLKRLTSPKPIARIALAGDAADGIGYLAVATLSADEEAWAAVGTALEAMLDRKALILDLRTNSGGEERRAQVLAAMLCDEKRVYARRRVRNGRGHADFAEPFDAVIAPRDGKEYAKPIAVLIGPACASSGEGFAQIMAALPHARLFGLPTRGASGNPGPVDLPNGVSVWFSRWVNLMPDGTPIEGRGVPPDVRVEPKSGADAALDAALAYLRERIAPPKGGTLIAGTVTEPDGTPVAGALVSMTLRVDSSDRGLGEVRSDARGRFEIAPALLDALSPGERSIAGVRGVASAPLHRPSPFAYKSLPPKDGPREIPWDFVLAPGASLSGRVLDAEGRPVASAQVVLCSDPGGNEHASVDGLTDAAGRYVLPVTKAGRFALSARKDGIGAAALEAPLALDLAHDPPDVDLTLRGDGWIEGKAVYPDGSPAAWLTLEAVPPKTEARAPAGGCAAEPLGLTTGHATTDDKGRFRIAGLQPGRYSVDHADVFDGTRAGAGTVFATGDTDAVVVCAVHRVVLHAVDEEGRPVLGARYHLHQKGPHLEATYEGIFSRADGIDIVDAETGAKGTVSATGTDLRSEEASFVVEDERFETHVTLVLKSERTPVGRLRVTVVGPDGKPFATFRAEAEPILSGAGSWTVEEFGPEDGGRSPALRPGKWDLTVRPGRGGSGTASGFFVPESRDVEVKDGEVTPVEVRARIGGKLRVTFRERGAKIPDLATVRLHSAAARRDVTIWPYGFVGADGVSPHLAKFLPDTPHLTDDAIEPGRFTVRLALPGVRAFETLVEIEAEKITDVELLVQPE